MCEEAQAAGVLFYELPSKLNPEQVDLLIRHTVFRINESGWVWTAESCQGHPDAVDWEPWANNTRPMLRLVCRKADFGRMMALLVDAMHFERNYVNDAVGFEVWPQRKRDSEWSEVLIYLKAYTTYDRNVGIAAYERFAELVNIAPSPANVPALDSRQESGTNT